MSNRERWEVARVFLIMIVVLLLAGVAIPVAVNRILPPAHNASGQLCGADTTGMPFCEGE